MGVPTHPKPCTNLAHQVIVVIYEIRVVRVPFELGVQGSLSRWPVCDDNVHIARFGAQELGLCGVFSDVAGHAPGVTVVVILPEVSNAIVDFNEIPSVRSSPEIRIPRCTPKPDTADGHAFCCKVVQTRILVCKRLPVPIYRLSVSGAVILVIAWDLDYRRVLQLT